MKAQPLPAASYPWTHTHDVRGDFCVVLNLLFCCRLLLQRLVYLTATLHSRWSCCAEYWCAGLLLAPAAATLPCWHPQQRHCFCVASLILPIIPICNNTFIQTVSSHLLLSNQSWCSNPFQMRVCVRPQSLPKWLKASLKEGEKRSCQSSHSTYLLTRFAGICQMNLWCCPFAGWCIKRQVVAPVGAALLLFLF